jgi:hypothetical protein
MADLEEALRIVRSHPDLSHFAGPQDEPVIQEAERLLGLKFPPTYRAFLQQLGAGSFSAAEFYGICGPDLLTGPIPNGIWCTLNHREKWQLPRNLVVIGDGGFGDNYCLDVMPHSEAPVIIHLPGVQPAQQPRETVANDFGAFFLEEIRTQLQPH